MIEGLTITVLDEFEQLGSNCPCEAEIVNFGLDIAGKMVHFRIDVTAKQATLADIVPLARIISTKLAFTVLGGLNKNKRSVPCRKGCLACCGYLIPLSVPEVFRLREELFAMPPDKSSRILKSCTIAAKRILDKSCEDLDANELTKDNFAQTDQISEWYSGLKLFCPFLSDGLCTLYEQRPLACREHIVTGSNFSCQLDHRVEPDVVPMPISVLEAIGQLTAELENLDIEAVMLPLVFSWAQDNLWRSRRNWPAVTMVKRFVEILEEMAVKNSTTVALST